MQNEDQDESMVGEPTRKPDEPSQPQEPREPRLRSDMLEPIGHRLYKMAE